MAVRINNLSDAELIDVATQTAAAMEATPGNYVGVSVFQVNQLKTARDTFSTDLTAHVSAQAAARAQTQTKNTSRAELEQILRTLRNLAIANGASEAAIASLGIPAGAGDVPTNATRPVGTIDTSQRLQHTIRFADEAAPDKRRRPRGTMGCEIWLKLDGAPPIDETECRFLAIDGSTPYLREYAGADAGKMAHYLLRWRFTDGSLSAWGETVSATVTG